MSKTIEGRVIFKEIGTGAWGIESKDGTEYRPVNFPEQLKKKGANVKVKIKPVDEDFSIHMWGEPVEIVGFSTLMP
ncbi:MAG: hypothetical protein KDC24_10190 [Saprospiraceae bacterium]|nr:hypothetical protein [Saprospiraceae bacterium]